METVSKEAQELYEEVMELTDDIGKLLNAKGATQGKAAAALLFMSSALEHVEPGITQAAHNFLNEAKKVMGGRLYDKKMQS